MTQTHIHTQIDTHTNTHTHIHTYTHTHIHTYTHTHIHTHVYSTAEEVMVAMNKARVPAGPILSTAALMAEQQFQQRGMIQAAPPPSGGPPVTMPALLPVLSATPGGTRWAGPELGEHTEEVLRGELGLGDQDLAALRAAGAI
ncbi:hypothetical protein Vafri_8210 [Volvox africanus]|nr:hypothetical protein Vafri_8210 [Volvox africanus]